MFWCFGVWMVLVVVWLDLIGLGLVVLVLGCWSGGQISFGLASLGHTWGINWLA